MFIPRGRVIHENLATSYVLVEALVADLSEGGFTGVVEVLLRDTDSHVIISRGEVTATVETRLNAESGARAVLTPAVAELAARAKLERGRVSVFSYPMATCSAISGRINSQPLYTKLSSEFADLERMLSKLGREPDKQWFIEIESASGLCALIHLNGERCLVMSSDVDRREAEANSADLMQNSEVRGLIDDFNRAGGTFDVFFKELEAPARATESSPTLHQWIEPPGLAREGVTAVAPTSGKEDHPAVAESQDEVAQAVLDAKTAYDSLSVADSPFSAIDEREAEVESPPDPLPPSPAELEEARLAVLGLARESEFGNDPFNDEASEQFSSDETQYSSFTFDSPEAAADESQEGDLLAVGYDFKTSDDLQRASEAEVMAEVKRLMAEIARTIEEAIESVEQRSTFPIHLRAGQLKVADRYPFLDPFGPEFEYLAGEIVFVGHVSPAEFVEGLTEALKLAVDGVAQVSAQPARVRGRVADVLRRLLNRQQTEFEAYGLDESVREILDA
ncbi:MAG: hypothetical protein AABO41_00690 [Acidobacteriota bacterium]